MLRRTLLLSAAALALPTQAQVLNLSDAINKAGRQRMLSQRMGKAWLALLHGVETGSAQKALNASMALFDRQHVELKAYAPTAELRTTYQQLESVWSDYKAALVGSVPGKDKAPALLALDAQVLALAHQGTGQYEAVLDKPEGKLVNVAGRQRMLSQRMAKFFLAATLQVDTERSTAEMAKAKTEFVAAMALLRDAPQATAPIKEELQLGYAQWVFFDAALQRMQSNARLDKAVSDVFVSSENLLKVMDRVTGMYAVVST
jgi:nitrate/nitrite-specific signal transduction histidine kinase